MIFWPQKLLGVFGQSPLWRPLGMFSVGCCCGGNDQTCCGCATYPDYWDVNVSGQNGTIESCDCVNLGGAKRLVRNGCIWIHSDVAACSPLGITTVLACSGDDMIFKIITGSFNQYQVAYILPLASWNCNASNVMPYDNSNMCANWPATVTLTPA
jgi:hypothetical protein